ncbi:hypothetical protein EI555_008377, partial [Monodon monoceros]
PNSQTRIPLTLTVGRHALRALDHPVALRTMNGSPAGEKEFERNGGGRYDCKGGELLGRKKTFPNCVWEDFRINIIVCFFAMTVLIYMKEKEVRYDQAVVFLCCELWSIHEVLSSCVALAKSAGNSFVSKRDHMSHIPPELRSIMSPSPVQCVSHKRSNQPRKDLYAPPAELSPPHLLCSIRKSVIQILVPKSYHLLPQHRLTIILNIKVSQWYCPLILCLQRHMHYPHLLHHRQVPPPPMTSDPSPVPSSPGCIIALVPPYTNPSLPGSPLSHNGGPPVSEFPSDRHNPNSLPQFTEEQEILSPPFIQRDGTNPGMTFTSFTSTGSTFPNPTFWITLLRSDKI